MLAPCLGVASLSGVLVAILYTGRRPYTIHCHYSTLYTNLNTLLHCDGLNFIHRHLPRLIHRQHAKRPLERGHLSCLSFQSSWRSWWSCPWGLWLLWGSEWWPWRSWWSACQHSPVMTNHEFRIKSGLKSFFDSNCGAPKSLVKALWDTLIHKGVEEERNLPALPLFRPNNVCEVIVGPLDSQCQLQSRAQCPQVLST